MTVITGLNNGGLISCGCCADPAEVAQSRYDDRFTLYLCRYCALALAAELVRDVVAIKEADHVSRAP